MSAPTTVPSGPVLLHPPKRSHRRTGEIAHALRTLGGALTANLWAAGWQLPYGAALIARERRR